MSEASPERPNPNLRRPPILLATWFGTGLLPKAPGTWGSLAALPFAWVIQTQFGAAALAAAALAAFALGIWAANGYIAEVGGDDPGPVVIDEVAGQWLSLVPAAADPVFYGLGFLLFRFFDIVKPWPVGWADRRLKGGLGVMVDDMLAGAYAAAVLVLVQHLIAKGV
ncbi:MAG: phosphatidylglycerophosphatase A [Magnetovibrio sp.]|nr:phosphatidylglycerophosphatase A [Magnetovibrio sp.]